VLLSAAFAPERRCSLQQQAHTYTRNAASFERRRLGLTPHVVPTAKRLHRIKILARTNGVRASLFGLRNGQSVRPKR